MFIFIGSIPWHIIWLISVWKEETINLFGIGEDLFSFNFNTENSPAII